MRPRYKAYTCVYVMSATPEADHNGSI